MPDASKQGLHCQTICFDSAELVYETLEASGGRATSIRFETGDEQARLGDVLLVLNGSEIVFHGMISSIADGWGVASDSRGSMLPASDPKRVS